MSSTQISKRNALGLAATGVVMFSLSSGASADVIGQDRFEYADTDELRSFWATPLGDEPHFAPEPLVHPSLPGSAGGHMMIGAEGSDRAARSLAGPIGLQDETVFISYLMRTHEEQTVDAPFHVLSLNYTQGNSLAAEDSNRVASFGRQRFWPATLGGVGEGFGHRDYTDGGTDVRVTTETDFDVHLLVLKVDFTNGGEDYAMDFWHNPDDTTDFTAESNRITGTGDMVFDTLMFNGAGSSSGGNPVSFDELRIANTAPTLVPEPGGLALLAAGAGLMLMRRRK